MNAKVDLAIRDLVESHGADNASMILRDLLEEKKVTPNQFSIKGIWEACQLAEGRSTNVQEAVVSYSFPKITGELINSKVIAGYEGLDLVGDKLVTTVPSKQRVETFAGFTAVEAPDEVGEGQDYNDSTLTEKYVTITNEKYGRLISITEEMIYFDQTGQILSRANMIGQKAAQWREKLIFDAITDANTTAWYPSGSATALYSSGNDNLITSNPFGESGMENLRVYMARRKDDSEHATSDDYIMINDSDMMVLVPKSLEVEALQLANSTLVPESAENAVNIFKGMFNVVTSPYLGTATDSTTWYGGDFKQDFVWTEVWPLQTISARPGNSREFTADIKAQMKVRFFGACGALDFRHVWKCTA